MAVENEDDVVVMIQNRVHDVERKWIGIKGFIQQAISNGDTEFCKAARELLPGMVASMGFLNGALIKAIGHGNLDSPKTEAARAAIAKAMDDAQRSGLSLAHIAQIQSEELDRRM